MAKKIIIFNAPPSSGKDVAADYIVNVLNSRGITSHHKEFKEPLFKAVKSAYGIGPCLWDVLYSRQYKEIPTDQIIIDNCPTSPRNAMIHMSENVMKPLLGDDVFGKMAARGLQDGINIFSDGGFKDEMLCLYDEVPMKNFLVIQVHREGFTFENDSRDYVQGLPNTVTVPNDGTLQEYLDKCLGIVEDFVYE